jgi:hypothetical protein
LPECYTHYIASSREHLTRWENEWSVIGTCRPFYKRVVVVVIFKKEEEEEEILTVQFQLGTLRFMDLVSSRERERRKKKKLFLRFCDVIITRRRRQPTKWRTSHNHAHKQREEKNA